MKKIFLCIFLIIVTSSIAHAKFNVTINPSIPKVGGTFVAQVESDNPIQTVSGSFGGKTITFYPWGVKFRGIIPVPLGIKPGKHILHVEAHRNDGEKTEINKYVTIKKTIFAKRWFKLKPIKMRLLAPYIIEEDWKKIEAVITRERYAQLWRGRFMKPANGRVTMPFGAIQYINGIKHGQHRGIDIAGKLWTKIRASNYGQVVMAEKLKAHGNTVIIDHGQGIFSMYLHLIKIAVRPKEIVWKGKVIGYMGSTGVASGTHVHWGLSIHNERIDPMQWVEDVVAQ